MKIDSQWLAEQNIKHNASKFVKARAFIEMLRRNMQYLTMAEYRDLRGIALDGEIEVAQRKFDVLMRNKN